MPRTEMPVYRCCVITDRLAEGAGVQARRWFPVGVAESQWLATVVLVGAAAAVMLTIVTRPEGLHQNGGRLLVPLIPLLACLPIVVLRRWPLPVLAVVTVAAGMATASGAPAASLPFGILLGLALYFSALGLPRPKSIALALAVATALGATVAYSAFAVKSPQVTAAIVDIFVPLAGAWFIADSVAARRRYQTGLATQAERERAAEVREERVRIAREMHDVVAHTLAVITVQAGSAGGWRASARRRRAPRSNRSRRSAGRPRTSCASCSGCSATGRPGPRRWHRRHGSSTSRTWSTRCGPPACSWNCGWRGPIVSSPSHSSCRSTASCRRR